MPCHVVIPVTEQSSVGEARRAAAVVARAAQLSAEQQGQAAIIATELATNLARYARNGMLLMQSITLPSITAVDFVAIDSGPGMDVSKCLADGYSTSGTAGDGLGAVRRLSSEFDIFSSASGSVVYSRLVANAATNGSPAFSWGTVCVPARGEEVCGDNWRLHATKQQLSVMIADGLGHGPSAAEASEQAGKTFDNFALDEPRNVVENVHKALSGTRGAAFATARLDLGARLIRYAGVGNISGTLCSIGTSRGLISHNGTAGIRVGRVQEFEYPYKDRDFLVMHSDGLISRWDLDGFPGVQARHPAIIAGLLYRDFTRGKDDVTIIVVKPTDQGTP